MSDLADRLTQLLEAFDDPTVPRAVVQRSGELVAAVLALHAEAVVRLSDALAPETLTALAGDPVVGALFELYGVAAPTPVAAPTRRRVALRPDDLEPLGLPVGLVVLTPLPDGTTTARYPSPAGFVQSTLELESSTSGRLRTVLEPLVADGRSLVVRVRGGEVDTAVVDLAGARRIQHAIRTRWEGFTGGVAVERVIDEFFEAAS